MKTPAERAKEVCDHETVAHRKGTCGQCKAIEDAITEAVAEETARLREVPSERRTPMRLAAFDLNAIADRVTRIVQGCEGYSTPYGNILAALQHAYMLGAADGWEAAAVASGGGIPQDAFAQLARDNALELRRQAKG